VGQTVTFTSTVSSGITPYEFSWQFGDGGSATTQNPTHAYSAAASYPVEFEVMDASHTSMFVNFTETVRATPLSVTASASPLSGVAPLPVVFTSAPSGGSSPYTYEWDFGDHGASSTSENASHTYATAGTYVANLTVKDATGATVPMTWTITAELPPLAVTISASTTAPTVGQNVTFTSTPSGGSAPYSFAWSFGDQGTSSIQDPVHHFGESWSFVVTLTVHDVSGHAASANVTVTVSAGGSSTSSSSCSGPLSSGCRRESRGFVGRSRPR